MRARRLKTLRLLTGVCSLILMGVPWGPAYAEQYRSEVRELPNVPSTVEQKSAEELLRITTDPYAKTLLLRDMAAQAAQQQDYDKAAKYLEQALAQGGVSGLAEQQMRDQLSELYLASGDYAKLAPQLEAQVRAGTAPPEIMVALASAYLQQKRYKDAVPLLRKAMASQSKPDSSWRRAYAAALLGAGFEKEALPQLEALLQDDPSQREDWMRLIALELKLGMRERAAALLDLAGRLGFLQTPDEWLQLVSVTANIGAPFEAGSLLQGKMEQGVLPANGANWQLLASLWIAAREDSLALPALEEAIERAPTAALYQQQAQLHMDREEYAEAARALQAAIDRGAADVATRMALGMARYQQADIDGALEAFRGARVSGAPTPLAAQWIEYLESGRAREQALAAAASRERREDGPIELSGRLAGGQTVRMPEAAQRPISESARSGGLTPVGAEADGNRDGSIPAWSGGLQRTDWPAGFAPGQRLRDPFAADRPLFTINAANMGQYSSRLSAGHQALLRKYPSYQMPVYPTRRSVGYPQAIYDATQANQQSAKLLGADALADARLGVPFPRPQSGVEIMWNHRTRYRGDTLEMQTTQAVVTPGRDPYYLKQTEHVLFRYANLSDPVDLSKQNILLYYLTWFGKSRNEVDFVALVHETANSLERARGIWVIPPKVPKMFRVPPVGYDQPFPGSEGLMFIDMIDMYNGAFDRYVWKLQGKREMYVPYNSFRLNDGRYDYDSLLLRHHLNPEAARYELHRVWVIEATEREGKNHSFGKRTFYVDEDSWNVVMVENEDHGGRLWRFQEGHLLPQYDIQSANAAPALTYDLKEDRYFINRLSAQDPPPTFNERMRDNDFLPAAVKGKYAR